MKISVYITSYNQKGFLKEAIDSVLNQTLQPYEIIIVDDTSTDGSQDLINDYKKNYPDLIKPHFNKKNLGITKSRNVALSLTKGDYITWLDGDDIYKPNKLKLEAELIQKTGADLVYSNFYFSHKNIDDVYQLWCSHVNELPSEIKIFKYVISRNFPRGILFRYELVNVNLLPKTGLYDENLDIYEDFDFRIRLSTVAKTAYLIEPLSVYRIHGKGLSAADKTVHSKNLNYIFSKYQNLINDLELVDKKFVTTAISVFMSRFTNTPKDKKTNRFKKFKNRVKNKLISLIKRL